MRIEHFWDILFQLMKHGANTLHAALIFLFNVQFDPNPSNCIDIERFLSKCLPETGDYNINFHTVVDYLYAHN